MIIGKLDFEKKISDMPDRQLLEFVARTTLAICEKSESNESRIGKLENGNKKMSSIIGGISGTITAVVIGIINYFMGRN